LRTTTTWRVAPRPRSSRWRELAVLSGAVGALASIALVPNALAAPTEHKVTICHATASHTNPYVKITVDYHSITQGGHGGHEGPVFDPSLTTKWGDIIPPFDLGEDATFPGANWDEGQSILTNGCKVGPATTTTTMPTTTATHAG
jgi:hypothetical protein